jgi:HKD family nuclease
VSIGANGGGRSRKKAAVEPSLSFKFQRHLTMDNFQNALAGVQGIGGASKTLLDFITEEIDSYRYTRISACAAYASYRGVVFLRKTLENASEPKYRWLLGLNDAITDPQAIRVAMGTRGAETRIVEFPAGKRFHPKAYLLDLDDGSKATLIIGSSNLTESALTKNCEVYSAIRAETAEQVEKLQRYWEGLWNIGEPATEALIRQYNERYERPRYRHPVVQEETQTTTPSRRVTKVVRESINTSRLVWIVLGRNTGGGNQLDIVQKLAPFLRLPASPREGATKHLMINSPLGDKSYQITFTKGMWRFMNLQQGFTERLRPDQNKPSPYVLVIRRLKNSSVPKISIQRLDSSQTQDMIEQSKKTGFVTSSKPGSGGRLHGWF